VPGKIAARKMTAPNSNVRAFHVESVCETYSRHKSGLVAFGPIDCGAAGSKSIDERELLVESERWLVMSAGDEQ
tara:strand:- start:4640 stop:4861 length:222 start_codon:yes stop_codon:yes gene_type:complete